MSIETMYDFSKFFLSTLAASIMLHSGCNFNLILEGDTEKSPSNHQITSPWWTRAR